MCLVYIAADAPCGSFGYWADALSKIGATAGVVGGGIWAVITYIQTRKDQAMTALLAAKQPFLMKRLELYTDATACAAAIAVSEEQAKVAEAKVKFWDLYWGAMAIVEDRNVKDAMQAFGTALTEGAQRFQLETLAIHLAQTCQDSLAADWHVNSPQSDTKPKPDSEPF